MAIQKMGKTFQSNLQTTIQSSIEIVGIGLHKGETAKVILKPALENSGIQFIRKDLPDAKSFKASFDKVLSTQLATTLGTDKTNCISTTEHLMAAIAGFGIDNLLIEVFGPEIPIMDGSSAPFCRALLDAGIKKQSAPRKTIRLKKKIEVKVDGKWAVAEPSSHFELSATIDWDHPMIGFQQFKFIDGYTDFSEIASARTFGFLKDVEQMKKIGLALGGSLENAVVLDEAKVLNPDGLRYADEFVRHKVLDAVGDFKLSGVQILGHFKLHRAGHELHRQILVEIFKDDSNYEWVNAPTSSSNRPHKEMISHRPLVALKAI